ncbi:MAG: AraC family transcriptional regulator, partial [Spirochaetaceae bacterium]
MTATEREYVRRINRVMDFIETNLEHPLPLERLAEVALFSKFHFHRVFFAQVGETPGQFIQRLRIEKAARLLLSNRERAVTEVALDCGFSDSAAFARAFRTTFGVSASEYRRRGKSPAGVMSDRNLSTVDGKQGKAVNDRLRYGEGRIDTSRRIEMPTLSMQPIPA